MAEKEAIMRALQEAMGGSTRPRMRPKGLGEAGKTISDADKMKIKMMMGEAGKTMSDSDRKGPIDPMALSLEQIKMLEQMMKQQQMKQGAAERKAFPPPSMMNNGGAVRKRKPKMGAVMSGRGGKYKGIK